MSEFKINGFIISSWILIPLFFILWVFLFIFLKRILFKTIHRFTSKTETLLDDVLISSLDFPLNIFILISGSILVERFLSLSLHLELNPYAALGIKAAIIFSVIIFLDKFFHGILRIYSFKVEILKSSAGVIHVGLRFLIIALGALVLLDSFGISITPILASLGIGSLAVALALQPTLENFFSGFQLIVDETIKLGHFIRLESGEEGYVHKIGWRSTNILTPTNNMILIPNKSIVNSKIINYYYPDSETAVLVEIGVHYNSNLEYVERVTTEIAKEILVNIKGGVSSFEPIVRFHSFGDSSINFTIILRAKEFIDVAIIKHEFIKKLHKRYTQEGIIIPYPIRAINLDQENTKEQLRATVEGKI